MSKREPSLLVKDIIDSAHKIISYTTDLSFDDFSSDEKTVDAVIRNFEIIGEAANRMPDDFKLAHNEVNWQRLRGFRNRIVHDYFGIDLSIVWDNQRNIPARAAQDFKKHISLLHAVRICNFEPQINRICNPTSQFPILVPWSSPTACLENWLPNPNNFF